MASGEVEISAGLEQLTLEDILSRHRRERRELQAKIQALKKTAPKKKRKETMEEVARMEQDLEKRHDEELREAQASEMLNAASSGEGAPAGTESLAGNKNSDDEQSEQPQQQQRISKAQKRRDKKAREARQREEEIRLAANDVEFAPKTIEAKAIVAKLKERHLGPFQVPSDGDCLYNAIRHQLIQSGLGTHTVKELRNETANYILANKDTLIDYMVDLPNKESFEKYCESVRSTPAWGGQIELKALSSVLKVPIEVIQASGPSCIQGEGEFAGPPLVITYHRHMYKLGEHYNSTVPLANVDAGGSSEADDG